MSNRWKQAHNAASDAVVKTFENRFDLFKTAKYLHEKHSSKESESKDVITLYEKNQQ